MIKGIKIRRWQVRRGNNKQEVRCNKKQEKIRIKMQQKRTIDKT